MAQWPLQQAESLKFTLKQSAVTSNISHHSTALHRPKAPSLFLQPCFSQCNTFPLVMLSSLQPILKSRQNGGEGGGLRRYRIFVSSVHSFVIYCYRHQLPSSSLALREPLEIFPLSHPGGPTPRLRNPGLVSGILLGFRNKGNKLHMKFLPTEKLYDSLFGNIL